MSQFVNPEETRLDPVLAALTAGSRVGGARFTLLRMLGRGGMGVVWLARDEHLREGVALKFLPPEIRHDAAALDDLRRETSRSRKLTHPHIIRIHDLYRSEQEAFISMEYVDGPNLSELRLQQPDRVLKWSFLEPLVKELCEALDYAHNEHIVHRDLKPANMMLDVRGRLKLADFGIAAVVTDSVSRVSMSRYALGGTACYMSPQQLDGQSPQVTDDIYSLGATLYELLTSRAPFFAGDIPHQVRTFAPQPLEKRLSQLNLYNPVPPAVCATILACLAKKPEERPQSPAAIAEQLGFGPLSAKAAAEAQLSTPSAPREPREPSGTSAPAAKKPTERSTSADPPVQAGPTHVHITDGGAASRNRRAPALAFAAVIVMLVGGVGAWWWWSQHRGENKTNAAQAAVPAAPEFIALFNGHDFSGWDGDPQVWSIRDGAITATNGVSKERRPLALFWRGGTVDDFELRLSFRIQSGNSGIYYRAKQLLGYEVGGYQFEITGNDATGLFIESGPDRMRRQPSRLGAVTTAYVTNKQEKVAVAGSPTATALELKNAFRPRAWNDVIILVQGNRIIHKLNGLTVVDATDHYKDRPRKGTIAFEVYGLTPTAVQFRDIRLKRLASPGSQNPAKKQ